MFFYHKFRKKARWNQYDQDKKIKTAQKAMNQILEAALSFYHEYHEYSYHLILSGFSDISYFNRCFRKKFGMTPQEYAGWN